MSLSGADHASVVLGVLEKGEEEARGVPHQEPRTFRTNPFEHLDLHMSKRVQHLRKWNPNAPLQVLQWQVQLQSSVLMQARRVPARSGAEVPLEELVAEASIAVDDGISSVVLWAQDGESGLLASDQVVEGMRELHPRRRRLPRGQA